MSRKISRRQAGLMAKKESEVWLYSYADLITNLLAFFILMVSLSNMDKPKAEVVRESIRRMTEVPFGESTNPERKFSEVVTSFIRRHDLKNVAAVQRQVDGVAITFQGGVFFESLSADLTPDAQQVLEKLAPLFNDLPKNMRVDVSGHTDFLKVTDDTYFPSNWELSAGRAAAVVRFLAEKGVSPTRMRVIGYADTKPVSKIVEQNRRVVIKVGRGIAQ